MNAAQLKASILQQAIEGKLVPQLQEEGVVEQIGKAPTVVPFEIPESWKWVKIKDVFSMQAGKFIKASEIKEVGAYPCYGGNGLRGFVDNSNRKGRFPIIGRQGALCGNIHVVDGEFYATEHAVVVNCGSYGDPDCVGLFLEQMNLNQYATATAQPGLAVKKIEVLPFPLPPLSEQKRIVAKIDELMPLVEEYGKAYDKLQELNDELPSKLKASILKEAIQGKLVPQLPEDGVVDQIGDAPAEVPFELPASWKWGTLTSICSLITDGTHNSPKNSTTKDSVYKNLYITAKNIKDYGIDLSKPTYVNDKDHAEITKRCFPCFGDILFVKDGATTGVVTSNNLSEPFSMLSSVALIRTIPSFMDGKFLIYVLRSPHISTFIRTKMKGTGITRVTLNILKSIPIPIPPLAEQKRIVAKVDTLLEQIDLMTK